MAGGTTTRVRRTRRAALAGIAGAVSAPALMRRAWAAEAVNVGVAVPLSGANAQFGVNSRNGIELVADAINAAGGIKALGGSDGVHWVDIEVASESSGRPVFALAGETAETVRARGISALHLSLSHDANLATAYVVAEAAA